LRRLGEEKKEKYVYESDDRTKEFNLKAFYKGHDYARKINPRHLSLLDRNSRMMVLEIDEVRRKIKDRKSVATSGEVEAMPDLVRPNAAVKPDNASGVNGKDFDKEKPL